MLNIAVLIFIRKHKIASSNAMLLIRIQTYFDLSMLIIIPIHNFHEMDLIYDLPFAIFYCYVIFYPHFYGTFTTCSLGILILLSLDRFMCIVMPLRYKSITKQKLYFAIAFILFLCFLFKGTYLFFMKIDALTNSFNRTIYNCSSQHLTIEIMLNLSFTTTLPFILSSILNIITTYVLLKTMRNRHHLNVALERSTKQTLVVRFTVANIISTFLYGFFLFLIIMSYILKFVGVIDVHVRSLYFYNKYLFACLTAVNPIVYMILFKNFRRFMICKKNIM